MKFDINNYKGNYAMHCKTEEEAKDFCAYLHSIGKRWGSGDSYLDITYWKMYRKDTVYFFNNDSYGDVEYASYNYTILEWEDFMHEEFTKVDLRTGDVILRRNGNVEIFLKELDMLISPDGFNYAKDLKSDLTAPDDVRWDIMAVRRPTTECHCQFCAFKRELGTLVYKRTEPVEMTLEEVCKLLGKEIKIVTREV